MRLIVGLQPVREAIRAHGSRVEKICIEEGDHPQLEALARFARDHGIEVVQASRAEMERRAGGARHQGAIARAPELRISRLADLEVGDGAILLGLDGIQDPQNFGAVIRSAVAMGAGAVIWPEHASAPLTPATFRASAGAIEFAKLCRVDSLVTAIEQLTARGVAAIGLDMAGDVELPAVDLTGPVLFVIGAEGAGLHKSVRRACGTLARLPMSGPIDSLNASVAAALAVYEAVRQRRPPAPP